MKIVVAGITRQHGKAKESGNPYDMTTVHVLNPIEFFQNENTTRQGNGFTVGEIPGKAELIENTRGFKFPGVYDLVTDTVFRNGKAQAVVVGLAESK